MNQNQLNKIFAYMESIRPQPENPQYRESEELIFGEELQNYVQIPGQEHSELERDPFASIKRLSDQITSHLFGDSKYGEYVKGIYIDIVRARKRKGKLGIKGMNQRGIICVCIMIASLSQGVNIDLKKLVSASNKVRTSTSKTTAKMVQRYLQFTLELLTDSLHNHQSPTQSLEKELRRLGVLFGYDRRELAQFVKHSQRIPCDVLSRHTPHIIAAAILYNKEGIYDKSAVDKKIFFHKLKISKQSVEKTFTKIFGRRPASFPTFQRR